MKTAAQTELDTRVNEVIAGFLSYLKAEKKTNLLPHIVKKLQHEIEAAEDRGEIVTAVPLTHDQIARIEEIVSSKMGRQIVLKNKVRNAIMGGIVIKLNDLVIDLSLKKQLSDIQKNVYS